MAKGEIYELYCVGWCWGYQRLATVRGTKYRYTKVVQPQLGHSCVWCDIACAYEQPLWDYNVLWYIIMLACINESVESYVFFD